MDIIATALSICASIISIASVIVSKSNSVRIKRIEEKSINVGKVKITGRGNSQIIGHGNSVDAQ